jgi:hypothetical protein
VTTSKGWGDERMGKKKSVVRVDAIQQRILLVRGEKVILDSDLAEFYGVTTKALNQAVRRNKDRFPKDFAFRLSKAERAEVATICDHLQKLKFSPVNPYAFTEHGTIMAATTLNSPRAVAMSVFVVRAFVRLHRAISESRQLANKVAQVERRLADHDNRILVLARAVKQLTGPNPVPERRRKQVSRKRSIALQRKGPIHYVLLDRTRSALWALRPRRVGAQSGGVRGILKGGTGI